MFIVCRTRDMTSRRSKLGEHHVVSCDFRQVEHDAIDFHCCRGSQAHTVFTRICCKQTWKSEPIGRKDNYLSGGIKHATKLGFYLTNMIL